MHLAPANSGSSTFISITGAPAVNIAVWIRHLRRKMCKQSSTEAIECAGTDIVKWRSLEMKTWTTGC